MLEVSGEYSDTVVYSLVMDLLVADQQYPVW